MKKIKNSYKKSGVDVPLANKLVKYISKLSKKDVKKTKSAFDKDIIGGFGSLFDISKLKIKDPVIVSCTDGVGTKIDLANKLNKFDLAGFSVGIVSKKKILSKNKVKNNDIILAIPSSGLHANGYSLVRAILKKNKIPKSIKKEILKPTKIYSEEVLKLVEKKLIHSSAHITGGGLVENLLRSIPDHLSVNINLEKIKILKIFNWLKTKNISNNEMLKTFNCGVGYCLIAPKKNILKIQKVFSKRYKPYEIGYITKNKKKVNLVNSLKW